RTATAVPGGGGRWAALPARETDPTVRAHALTQVLLERHGVLTRSGAAAEGVGAGYRDVYRVLSGLEERGAVRRGYFVEHLGGSQFALPGAVDRLRVDAQDRTRLVEAELETVERARSDAGPHGSVSVPGTSGRGRNGSGPTGTGPTGTATTGTVVLAAMDPANPYGAALAWPAGPAQGAARDGADDGTRGGAQDGGPGERATTHRPGRKAGAVVVLTHGDLTLFVERGGRTVLSFTENPARLAGAAAALARTVREGRLGRLTVQRVDGEGALEAARRQPAARALVEAGFAITPRGLRIAAR
ncbi:DEAD/DEAH box helicase, partial [Promicromonospora citrea]|nr:DEAD/DEAH box helicase [Promicromonospora citrea]